MPCPPTARTRSSGSCAAKQSSSSPWSTATTAWEAPTGAGHWQVRDIVGHIVDTTEAYFASFDAARSHADVEPAYGLPGMAARVDAQAQALRSVPRAGADGAAPRRLRQDDGDVRRADRGRLDRPAGPALLHGPAAGVLLPRVPAHGLRRPLVGRPRRARAAPTACPATPPTCSPRSCSCSGRRRRLRTRRTDGTSARSASGSRPGRTPATPG